MRNRMRDGENVVYFSSPLPLLKKKKLLSAPKTEM